jgi:formylglycine-generating enzyme required for sulfatase activity
MQNHIDREKYILIHAGTLLMGCVPTDTKCDKSEKPQHKVELTKNFWMGINEVQVTSYMKFLTAYNAANKTKRKPPPDPDWNRKWNNDGHPISNMSWQDAVDYCTWAGGRLPTEAEWEYAARAGKENEVYPFPLEKSRDKANFFGQEKAGGVDIFENTAPVGKFDANEWGLFDMAGNVWEFVYDFFDPGYYAVSPAKDPQGPETGKLHVRRGGSFYSSAEKHLRISLREPSKAENNVGFRCVMDDNAKTKEILQIK